MPSSQSSRCTFLCAALALVAGLAGAVEVTFVHAHDESPLRFDSLRYTNEAGEEFSSTRLSYLVSGFSFAASEGKTPVTSEAIGFIDGPRSRTTVALPDVSPGRYDRLTFHLGVDEKLNHADPAQFTANHPLNPNLNNLHWDWQGGYIFLALEGHWRMPGQKNPDGYAYHFATDRNFTAITLEGPFTVTPATELVIALDLRKVLAGLSFARDGATTHSQDRDPVSETLRRSLVTSFRFLEARHASPPSTPERVIPIDLPENPTPYPISLPRHIPLPELPLDNPILTERVTLGRKLFHDPALSRTGTISCASCHQEAVAFTDPRQFSLGVDGQHPDRHSMPLINLAWKSRFFWDGRAPSLRAQVLVPIEDHLEMDESLENVVRKLKDDPNYPPLFAAAFGSGEISSRNLSLALENFLLTTLSFDSKFDRAMKGRTELSPEEERGMALFLTESEPRLGRRGADCFHCHGGALFSDHQFHNTGLPGNDPGLFKVTGEERDRKKFSTPSLRNVALTPPYMHDGRFATLKEVIDHYDGGFERSPTLDPNLAKHRAGLGLSETEKAELIAFLKTLTDYRYIEGEGVKTSGQ